MITWYLKKQHIVVVSRVLRVSKSSGHQPYSKNLQNKQCTDGGVLIDSPMLKLDKEVESVKMSVLQSCIFHIPFCCRCFPYLLRKMMIHFLWKVSDWFPKWKGGRRFTCASSDFPFGLTKLSESSASRIVLSS